MRIFYFSLFIIVVSSCKAYYYSLSETERGKVDIKAFSSVEEDSKYEQFYSITSKDVPLLLNNQDNNLIVFFAPWCAPCKEKMPSLLSSIKNTNINLSLISPDDIVRKPLYEKYVKDLDYKGNIYFLDIKTYSSWNPHKNMKLFIKESFPKVDNVKGFPTGILLSKDSIVYTGVIDSIFISKYIKSPKNIF